MMQTYAILDAPKVMNLPDLLESSGMKHRCLFKGDAYDELKYVAPWLVCLEEDNSLIRNLFTLSDASYHLWNKEAGIFIRSRHDFDSLWRHFRKFTRIQDENKKWFYWRFWDCEVMNFVLGEKNWLGRKRLFYIGKAGPSWPLIIIVYNSQGSVTMAHGNPVPQLNH